MWPEVHHHHLASEAPERLRPTQMSVGLAEVARKRREWAALGRKQSIAIDVDSSSRGYSRQVRGRNCCSI